MTATPCRGPEEQLRWQAVPVIVHSGSGECRAGVAITTLTSGTPAVADEEQGPPVPRLRWGAKPHVARR
ncbi:hypothetical protein NDU88_002539 [Pleurodeles waltl]|uniref:Uncharacterized protein n=1 Tax=Pleurodeles waltl TaxID=8319 RepID=A0AAV7M3M9_PLEWA|nr:hypothetical protein NDU88_002539 [Pleurodeles waltl]